MQAITKILATDPRGPTAFDKRFSKHFKIANIFFALAMIASCAYGYRKKSFDPIMPTLVFGLLLRFKCLPWIIEYVKKNESDYFEDAYRKAFADLIEHETKENTRSILKMNLSAFRNLTINRSIALLPKKELRSYIFVNEPTLNTTNHNQKRRLYTGYLASLRMLQNRVENIAKKMKKDPSKKFHDFTGKDSWFRNAQYCVAFLNHYISTGSAKIQFTKADYLKLNQPLSLAKIKQRITGKK